MRITPIITYLEDLGGLGGFEGAIRIGGGTCKYPEPPSRVSGLRA